MAGVSISEAEFAAYGWQHLTVLALTGVIVVTMCRVERSSCCSRVAKFQRYALASLMLLIFPLSLLAGKLEGIPFQAGDSLPMHLCDLAALTGFVALVWRRPLFAELTYFWGLAGTLQGLATPDIQFGFPDSGFIIFFLLHGGVVIAALYLVIGLRIRPRRKSVWRMFLWTQVYVVAASATNVLLGTNYGYLREKPAKASLLDHMGEWPCYILVLEAACVGLFLLLDLPFAIARRRERRAGG